MTLNPPIQVRRREYLVAPGEGLILSPDLLTFSERHQRLLDDADLGADDLIASPVAGIPVPQAARGSDGTLLRWEGVDPAMMWHPFFWLPATVALRIQVQTEEGAEFRPETDEEWLLRVLIQMVDVGLFDIETGTWLDVLSMYGIDIEDEAVRDRIYQWNAGAEDPDFDRIDLSDLFENVGPHSSLVANILIDTPEYVKAQGALTADFLARSVADLREDMLSGELDVDDQSAAVAMYSMTAHVGFSGTDGLGASSYLYETKQVFEFVQNGGDLDQALDRLADIASRAEHDFAPSLAQIAAAADQLEHASAPA